MSDPSDPTPERPTSLEDVTAEKEQDGEGGQVSTAGGANLDPEAATTPISDTDSVAGHPDPGVQEPAEAGPNAVPEGNRRANRADHDVDHEDARPAQE